MDCDHVRQLISEGFDRQLTVNERALIAEHTRGCASCARFQHALRSGLDGIHRLPEIVPSASLWERVHTETSSSPAMTPAGVMRQAAGMIGAAAVVALVAAITIFLLNSHSPGSSNKQPQIASGTLGRSTASQTVVSVFNKQPSATPDETVASISAIGTSTVAPSTPQPSISVASATQFAPDAAASPTTIDEQTAEQTVVAYFHAINLQNYASAYDYLGTSLQQNQTFNQFASGYTQTKHDTVTITTTKENHLGQFVVTIYLDAEQNDGSVRHYHGNYVVALEHGAAKIVDASVVWDNPVTPTPAATTPVAACRSTDLSITAGYQGATGSMAGSIVLTNTGTKPCTLQGTAAVKILDSTGVPLQLEQTTMSLNGTDQPVTVAPQGQASVFFMWSNWCPVGTNAGSSARPITGGVSFQVTLPSEDRALVTRSTIGTGHNSIVPSCEDPSQPSTLSVAGFEAYPMP